MTKKTDARTVQADYVGATPLWLPQFKAGTGRRAGTGACPYARQQHWRRMQGGRIPNGIALHRRLILPATT